MGNFGDSMTMFAKDPAACPFTSSPGLTQIVFSIFLANSINSEGTISRSGAYMLGNIIFLIYSSSIGVFGLPG